MLNLLSELFLPPYEIYQLLIPAWQVHLPVRTKTSYGKHSQSITEPIVYSDFKNFIPHYKYYQYRGWRALALRPAPFLYAST